MKPFSQACENNKLPILAVLETLLADGDEVLEIGTGTGQHAVCFGAHLPRVVWRTSDLPEHHRGIDLWLEEAGLANVEPPLALDVNDEAWPVDRVDAVFSANTAHIMDWGSVAAMFRGVGRVLARDGVFALYGPFRFGGDYTSESNRDFDQMLRRRDPRSGLRDFESLDALAGEAGLLADGVHPMPANNHTVVWRRRG